MKKLLCLVVACLAFAAPAHAQSDPAAVAEVEKFYADFKKVLNSEQFAKDPAIALPYFADDIRLFDLTLPEQYTGDAFRKQFIAASAAMPGKTDIVAMNIRADKDVAVATYIQHFVGKAGDGSALELRVRTSDGLMKINGKWRIVHAHLSVPLDAETLGALMVQAPAGKEKAP